MEVRTIRTINQIVPKEVEEGLNRKSSKGTIQFSQLLESALNRVNELQIESDEYKKLLLTGDLDNLHDVTIAAEKANISFQLTLSIRNKIIEAYREIMRMQI
ncbi:flagellar hook-basal body complex protein FliE [Tepidimicrobium xylanilyticum]|uniref:Flagellar hook-basal body complex protein FliE n=1 Tax=Tepidimicrobium xylanilyticum TaxID=1123352 RepID=A0A1H2YIP5_9FIRM|nr:flagellar hook-basal body complex protein FliE [Tepidimicrobium xylanilyticum]SDX04678.1 flagellar hook-basal body complex protein FliE [Tepidimicrobium xylanilyticum]